MNAELDTRLVKLMALLCARAPDSLPIQNDTDFSWMNGGAFLREHCHECLQPRDGSGTLFVNNQEFLAKNWRISG